MRQKGAGAHLVKVSFMFGSFRGCIHFIVERTGWGEKPVIVPLQDPVSAGGSAGGPARVLRALRAASLQLISTMISEEGALSQPESQLMCCGCLHVYLLPAFNSTSRSSTCTSAGEGGSRQQGALCAQREPPLFPPFRASSRLQLRLFLIHAL